MEYLTLNNNTQMPLVGFGTFLLNGKTCTTAVASAIQTGYRMIDTAEAYGNEKKLHTWLMRHSVRVTAMKCIRNLSFLLSQRNIIKHRHRFCSVS